MTYQDTLTNFIENIDKKNVVESKKCFNELMQAKVDEVSAVLKFEVASNLFKDNKEAEQCQWFQTQHVVVS